jgi:hypothetical protein
VQFRAEFSNFTLEFNGSELSIFAAYNRRDGERRAYRQEYLAFQVNSIEEQYFTDNNSYHFHTFDQPRWSNIVWANSSRIVANTTKINNVTIQMIFDLEAPLDPAEPGNIKFSFAVLSAS